MSMDSRFNEDSMLISLSAMGAKKKARKQTKKSTSGEISENYFRFVHLTNIITFFLKNWLIKERVKFI